MKTFVFLATVTTEDDMTGEEVLKALREGFVGSKCDNSEWADEDQKVVTIRSFGSVFGKIIESNDCA